MSYRYYIVYKPYQVLSQFTSIDGKLCLKDFFAVEEDVYPIGRLDYDSEGLLILTNDPTLNARLLNPKHAHRREYLVQCEGIVSPDALNQIEKGVQIRVNAKLYQTQPCRAKQLTAIPTLPERNPPIRQRKHIPTSWVSLYLTEGKNRQVRKMMARVGYPVLRLVRYRIEQIHIEGMKAGDIRRLSKQTIYLKLFGK
ncbi:MAG: pseudouridine synthase [Chitinophagaceae bacterium]|nr:pseudouridine synthase [Chitinophagaceae bacterium]